MHNFTSYWPDKGILNHSGWATGPRRRANSFSTCLQIYPLVWATRPWSGSHGKVINSRTKICQRLYGFISCMFWLNYSDFHMLENKNPANNVLFRFRGRMQNSSLSKLKICETRAEFRLYFPQSTSKFVKPNPPSFCL